MTNEQFFMELDYCYAQLNPVTVERTLNLSTGEVIIEKYKQPVSEEHIEVARKGLLILLIELKQRGWYGN